MVGTAAGRNPFVAPAGVSLETPATFSDTRQRGTADGDRGGGDKPREGRGGGFMVNAQQGVVKTCNTGKSATRHHNRKTHPTKLTALPYHHRYHGRQTQRKPRGKERQSRHSRVVVAPNLCGAPGSRDAFPALPPPSAASLLEFSAAAAAAAADACEEEFSQTTEGGGGGAGTLGIRVRLEALIMSLTSCWAGTRRDGHSPWHDCEATRRNLDITRARLNFVSPGCRAPDTTQTSRPTTTTQHSQQSTQ